MATPHKARLTTLCGVALKLLGFLVNLKVFGKGFGKEPFFRKVCPDKKQNFHIKNTVKVSVFINCPWR